jgi:catechol 2,3-dioxygenase-like lactoylglutathione lyase family enzyme
MPDRITANLPARDMDATEAFYAALGFATAWKDAGWMILRRGPLELEIFAHPEVDKWSSCFSACIRVADPDALHRDWSLVGLPTDAKAIPRLTGFFTPGAAPRMFALVDPDGSLLRVMGND